MNSFFLIAALLIWITGLIHSVLGEKMIVIPLFKKELPPLTGSVPFMKRVLRFAWHLTTVAWWGIGIILFRLAEGPLDPTGRFVINVIAWVCLISGISALVMSRGRHFVWMVFMLVTGLLWWGL